MEIIDLRRRRQVAEKEFELVGANDEPFLYKYYIYSISL